MGGFAPRAMPQASRWHGPGNRQCAGNSPNAQLMSEGAGEGRADVDGPLRRPISDPVPLAGRRSPIATAHRAGMPELILLFVGGLALVALVLLAFLIAPMLERAIQSAPLNARPGSEGPDAALPFAKARLRSDLAEVFTEDFYPAAAKRAGIEGRTAVSLSVDHTGAVTDCKVRVSSGNAEIDAVTCGLSVDRVRYDPARDGAGRPTASTELLAVRWQLNEG